jgi:LmbE family N-acetylglucosaminyl deacetylase
MNEERNGMLRNDRRAAVGVGAVVLIALVAALAPARLTFGQAQGQRAAQAPVVGDVLANGPAMWLAHSEATVDATPLDIDRGAAGAWQALLKLRTRASLLLVEAHPDDEDGGMLTYHARGQGTRTAMLTMTRGEGGQNIMSEHFYDALGLVRTHELLAAGRYYGVKQYWATVTDFGFSKTREETLEKWGHERALADAVRVIRMTRPLVVVSTFVGGETDGHGHHAVAGQIAQEAFVAAGDPNMFPEQLRGRSHLRPWTPLKMYARLPGGGATRVYSHIEKKWLEGPLTANVEIPVGTYDPILGSSYLQIARRGWSLQKSQNGGGGTPLGGPAATFYRRFASKVPSGERERSYFDGIDVSLAGIADLAQGEHRDFLRQGLARVSALVEQAMSEFSATQPERIAPRLAEGLAQITALRREVESINRPMGLEQRFDVVEELSMKQRQFQQAIVAALGVSVNATVGPLEEQPARNFAALPTETFAYAAPGQEFGVKVRVHNPTATPLTLGGVWVRTAAGEWNVQPEVAGRESMLDAGQAIEPKFTVRVPENANPTRPYFHRPDNGRAYYDISDENYRSLSFGPYPLIAQVEFIYQGVPVGMEQVVQTVRRQVGQGLVLNPLVVAPPISVQISPSAGVTPLGSRSLSLSAVVRAAAVAGAKGAIKLELPAGWRAEPASAPFSLERAGEEQSTSFEIFPDRLEEKSYQITAVAESGGKEYREGFVAAGYPGLRPYNLYQPATYRTTGVNVTMVTGLRVGYVMGTGDDVPESLENLGIKAEFLSPQDLATGDLRRFDLILLGVRAYAARPELAANNSRLLEYVRNGGVAVVQYNTAEYNRNYGPYPYNMANGTERVSDETSPVNFIDTQSPVLTWPNVITARDFAGWMDERGRGFLRSWDPQYQAPLETHDPGQAPQRGGLLYARHGRGLYVYTALAFYRQLPEGVPGAYRLMANLLSLPRNRAFQGATDATGSR